MTSCDDVLPGTAGKKLCRGKSNQIKTCPKDKSLESNAVLLGECLPVFGRTIVPYVQGGAAQL
jgi:hypothetical protein